MRLLSAPIAVLSPGARRVLTVAVVLLFSACGGSRSEFGALPGARADARNAMDATSKYAVLFSFENTDGNGPAGLLDVRGTLYGTTYTGGTGTHCADSDGCGTVFSMTTDGKETVLHNFVGGADGDEPNGKLTEVNGTIYGTTRYGGGCKIDSLGCGTVFRITTDGKERVIYSFQGHSDAETPTGTLLDVNGTLYGTSQAGGARRKGGTLFSVTTAGKERVLCIFAPENGIEPSPVVNVDGLLFGTMYDGGPGGDGTVFSVTLTGKEKLIYSFTGTPNGAFPSGGVLDVNGTLYGTTSSGGTSTSRCYYSSNQCGTVFSITTTGKEKVLYRFGGAPSDGSVPNGTLLALGKVLYGTTETGGVRGRGTVFAITTAGQERVLHSFTARYKHDGRTPSGGLAAIAGQLFGTTSQGGDDRAGTVFTARP